MVEVVELVQVDAHVILQHRQQLGARLPKLVTCWTGPVGVVEGAVAGSVSKVHQKAAVLVCLRPPLEGCHPLQAAEHVLWGVAHPVDALLPLSVP